MPRLATLFSLVPMAVAAAFALFLMQTASNNVSRTPAIETTQSTVWLFVWFGGGAVAISVGFALALRMRIKTARATVTSANRLTSEISSPRAAPIAKLAESTLASN